MEWLISLQFVVTFFLILVVTFVAYSKYAALKRSRAFSTYPTDKVILHQVGKGAYAPSISPFPLKLETYLRMAKIPYENDHTYGMSSKRKTPWITYNGQHVADSQFCIEFLNKTYAVNLNSHLSSKDRAIARAFQKLTEENLYWTMCVITFGKDLTSLYEIWPYPGIWGSILARILQLVVKRQLWAQGMGRHTREEVLEIAKADLAALSEFLGSKPFFMGEKPCEVDCAIFGMLAQIMWHQRGTELEKFGHEIYTNLRDYCCRMKAEFWPDWNKCIRFPSVDENGVKQ